MEDIDAVWLARHYPALRLENCRIWNPAQAEQEMLLDLVGGTATVRWPHCQQRFRRGQVEDFSSWDDHSQPWLVDWVTWRNAWLAALRDGTPHVRPGRDPAPRRPWLAFVLGTFVYAILRNS